MSMSGCKVRKAFGARGGESRSEGQIGRTVAGVLALAGLIGDHGVARAQAASTPQADTLEEVVVTGSRIKRRDYDSQSPIVTVNSDAFQNKASVAIESTLNQLPQFKPSGSQSALSPHRTRSPRPRPLRAPKRWICAGSAPTGPWC